MNPEVSLAEARHRLRTPLNHVLGYSQMLLEDGDQPSEILAAELQKICDLGKCITMLLQNTVEPGVMNSANSNLSAFRNEIARPVEELVRAAGAAVQLAPEKNLRDVLRIASGAAELFEFVQGGDETQAPAKSRSQTPALREPQAKACILLVDDDPANRDILSRQLQRMGFEVITAENGEDALEKLQVSQFDLALVDFMMPGTDGLGVLEAIKANPRTRDLPVLMISALDELLDVTRCIERGADDYLFKPFDPILLTARISAALERMRLRARERERANELERISQELQRSNEDLKRFAYAASHDLQAPLRTITTHLQLLERHVSGRLSASDLELIRFPVDAALRMSQLIKDLLTYSQVSTEERTPSLVSCEKVLAATEHDLATEIQESGATITHDVLPSLIGDEVQLRQLFLNLIGNSIKYRGEVALRIHVGVCREGSAWHFTVSDNGVGIPADYIQEIFKLFRRLHGHERPGTGLGLAICKRIVDRVGGQIWVESQLGMGSTFHFKIPDEPQGPQ